MENTSIYNDQNDNVVVPGSSDTMKDISWVWGNISENGCGVIAVYNVMAVTNRNYSFISSARYHAISRSGIVFWFAWG